MVGLPRGSLSLVQFITNTSRESLFMVPTYLQTNVWAPFLRHRRNRLLACKHNLFNAAGAQRYKEELEIPWPSWYLNL